MPGDEATEVRRIEAPQSPLIPLQIAWIAEETSRIRVRQTAWEGYQRAGIVEPDEVQQLRAAERSQGDVAAQADAYAALYAKLLGKISRTDTLQVVLVLLINLVEAAGPAVLQGAIDPLLKLLASDDIFVQVTAAQLIVAGVSAVPASKETKAAAKQLMPVLTRLVGQHGGDAALLLIAELLRLDWVRSSVWESELEEEASVIPALLGAVRADDKEGTSAERTQIQYLALFALWIFTFDKEVARGLDVHFGAASILVTAGRGVLKEKIIRMIVSIFANMLRHSSDNAARLLGAGAMPLAETLRQRRYADPDLEQGLDYVLRQLHDRLELMSSYDQYIAELESGHLLFDSPTHTLEDFWRENAERLVENDGRDLAKLVRLLGPTTPEDPTTYAVACSDVAYFLRYFESGRRRLDALGAKARIMELVEYPDGNVKHYALQALTRLVSASWR
ncbi:H(+)-transporting V1 sector ATPase subunit H [Malassezia cuniculi]|uniref:H(+)-transporting V1 sector ATPase subunit H n=1 Tax=Malassezia cuniculi TaxID=948313 RepID=A0AAF0EUS2_9BASI|nr:H(+)-transporting V1 sector ATPase subunit H [Malassezia cuniculi]